MLSHVPIHRVPWRPTITQSHGPTHQPNMSTPAHAQLWHWGGGHIALYLFIYGRRLKEGEHIGSEFNNSTGEAMKPDHGRQSSSRQPSAGKNASFAPYPETGLETVVHRNLSNTSNLCHLFEQLNASDAVRRNAPTETQGPCWWITRVRPSFGGHFLHNFMLRRRHCDLGSAGNGTRRHCTPCRAKGKRERETPVLNCVRLLSPKRVSFIQEAVSIFWSRTEEPLKLM